MTNLQNEKSVLKVSRIELAKPYVHYWLTAVAVFIFAMVIVGGATRLTDSGLSITEWQPLLGTIPPLNSADWQLAFEKYQQSSEFKLQNSTMDLAAFKYIYWWEWAHRFLGRFIGVVFLVPFMAFAISGRLETRMWPRLLLLFILGGAQGALGWYMVSSGLVDRVDVSHYRLAAHLTLAVALFAAVIWVKISLDHKHSIPRKFEGWISLVLVILIFFQIASGGFVAGLDAGMGYNTWPLMAGKLVPSDLYIINPVWLNFFENALTVQFNHRILAYVILCISIWHALRTFSGSAILVALAVFVQACLGIVTLLLQVPLGFALAHQATALVVVLAAVWDLHKNTTIKAALI